MPSCDCLELVGLLTAQLFHWPIYLWGLAALVVREGAQCLGVVVCSYWVLPEKEAVIRNSIQCSSAHGTETWWQPMRGRRAASSLYALESQTGLLGILQALHEPPAEFAEVPWDAEMGGEPQWRFSLECKHQGSWSSKCHPTPAVALVAAIVDREKSTRCQAPA